MLYLPFNNRYFLLVGDITLILFATYLSPWICVGRDIDVFITHTGASAFTLFLYITLIYIFDLYNLKQLFLLKGVFIRVITAMAIAGLISTFLFYSLPKWKYGRDIFFIQMFIVTILLSIWRIIYIKIFSYAIKKENVIILGAGRCGNTLIEILDDRESNYNVVGFLDDDPDKQGQKIGSSYVIGTIENLNEITTVNNIKTVILAISNSRSSKIIKLLIDLRLRGLNILDMPDVQEEMKNSIPIEHIRDEWLLFTGGFYLISKQHIKKLKRIIDFITSLIILIASLPILVLTSIVIRLDSPGPIFFRQERIGKGTLPFILWKFRSMNKDAEENGPVWAQKNDKRLTRVGKWIRLLRIDELPQLINVFRGEMSLIGPRPERTEFVKNLEKAIPYYNIRHSIKPGITGWAQVNYPYGSSLNDARKKLEYDLYYIKNMSIFLDIKIILKTIGVVIFGQGAR